MIVERLRRGGLPHRDHAERRVVVVLGLPQRAVELDHRRIERRIVQHLGDGVPRAHGGRVHERLERGARRPRGLRHTIPLRVDEVTASDHRQDISGLGIDGEQRTLEIGRKRALVVRRGATLFDVLAVRGALEFAVRVDTGLDLIELRLQGLLRRLLHIEVERRVNAQAFLVQIASEARLEERRAQPLDEVGRHIAVAGAACRQHQRIGLPVLGVLWTQESLIAHQVENRVAPPHGAIGMGARVVRAGRLGQPGKRRGLGNIQVARRLTEKHLRGSLDPSHVGTEADLIQIQLENRVLGEVALELDGNAGLPQFAGDLLFLAEVLGEHVTRELHRDRGKPLRVMQRRDVGLERAEDAPVVDAAVVVEALVFYRDERLAHVHGDLLERQDGAPLDAQLRDQAAISRVDFGRLLRTAALRIEAHDTGAAFRGADPCPRPVGHPGPVQQRQHRCDDGPFPLDGIVPPADEPGAAR